MVLPVHGTDPEKMAHRTYKTLEPKGEIAVVQRPEGIKLVFYSGTGKQKVEHIGITLQRDAAFELAMEMLQQVYRVGEVEE
jgi:hypothetical protein